MGLLFWVFAHVMFVMWFVKSSRRQKQQNMKQLADEIKEKPLASLYLFTVFVAIELFILGIFSPSLFSFEVETPFGVYESWFLALLYGIVWWLLGLFTERQ
ncbi:hypothetical protein ACOLNO_004790 [Vibrio parahaemolyticus]|nr:hypothetical protein [Vibrio parahaemolyticus]EGQ9289467.1 hypothetical protein [Vibrio parahaemolyticus]